LSYISIPKKKLSFSLGKYITVFQTELCAIKVCAVQNLDRGYGTGNIYIPLDSQAAMRALDSY
jgi:hypothetical protein